MQLWKHPNGTYYVLHGPRLKRQLSTRTRDKRQADAFLANFIAGQADPQPDAPTVGKILAGYETDKLPKIRSTGSLTYAAAALHARLGDLKPEHLTPATIERYARERGAKAGTILREIGVLRAALKWAHARRWIAGVPTIKNPVQAPPPRGRWLTREEAGRLLAGCREPHIRLFVILGLTTAARTGAILALTWAQVDLERAVADYGTGHGNKRRSLVPLNPDALRALRAARELACSDNVIEFRGRPVETIKNGFQAACDRAELTDVTPHILRHTAATWMVMDGVPLAEVARVLGDSEAMVEKVYAKHTPGYLARATAALKLPAAAP
jgi:integrase